MKMRALVLHAKGNPTQAFEIREVARPEVPSGGVRIRVEASGLNFADVMAMRGLYPDAPPPPAVLGYDVAGIVESVGKDVDAKWIGKRVFALTRFGGHAEFAVADARAVAELPAAFTAAQGTGLATQVATAVMASELSTQVFEGETALVLAASGGVGLALTRLLTHRGVRVVGVVSREAKASAAREAGAAEVWIAPDPAALRNRDQKFDAIFDSVGARAWKALRSKLAPGGRYVCLGASDLVGSKLALLSWWPTHPLYWMTPSQSLVGVNMLSLADHKISLVGEAFRRTGQYIANGVLTPSNLRATAVPAARFGEAFGALEDRSSIGKLALTWTSVL